MDLDLKPWCITSMQGHVNKLLPPKPLKFYMFGQYVVIIYIKVYNVITIVIVKTNGKTMFNLVHNIPERTENV